MIYYYGKQIAAAVTLARPIDVACEKCQCAYRYRLVRRGVGRASAPYGLGVESANQRAREQARQRAERLLAAGVEPVACPDCGWIQTDMVRELTRRTGRRLTPVAIVVPIAVVAVGTLVAGVMTKGFERPFDRLSTDSLVVLYAMAAVAGVVPVALLAVRTWMRRGVKPNAAYPARPDPIAGAPPAVRLADVDPSADPAAVELLDDGPAGSLGYARREPDVLPGGWVTVQLLNVAWPDACTRCLTPTGRTAAYHPLGQSLVTVRAPLCAKCAGRARRWPWGAGVGGVLAGVGVMLPTLLGGRPSQQADAIAGLCLFPILFGGVGWLLGGLVPRTVRTRRYSAERNTIQIRFRHPAYTDPFLAANRAAAVRAVTPLVVAPPAVGARPVRVDAASQQRVPPPYGRTPPRPRS